MRRFRLSFSASDLLSLSFTNATYVSVERAWLPLKMELQWPAMEVVNIGERERRCESDTHGGKRGVRGLMTIKLLSHAQ